MSNMAFGIWYRWCDEKPTNLMEMITSLVAILAVIWFFWSLNKWRKRVAPLPPGPRGLPIIGYLPFLGTHMHKTFTELAGVYGPIYKLWLGNKICVVVSSPSLVKELVRDQDTIFANRDPPVAVLVLHGGKDPYGPEWKKMRKVFVSKMMSNASLDACYTLRKQEVKNIIRDVYNRIGKTIEFGDLSFTASINVIQNILWGSTLQGENGTDNLGVDLRELFAELMVLFGTPNISDIFPVFSRFDLQGIAKRTKEITIDFDKIIDSAIERSKNIAMGNTDGKKDLLRILLELMDHNDTATSITMTQLKGMLTDILVGGTDTTTTMIEWTMAELMQHPKVMKKVQEELTEVVGINSSVEEFHLPKLLYLDAVVKEAMRLHPALPLLAPRCPSQSTIVGGYTIPKGARIMLNVWAIHRDPQLWDNPLEFRPERFLNNSENFNYLGNNFQYMPFGSGRRICAGIPLAERMLMFLLASLLHSFEWKLPYNTKLDLSDKFGIVIKKLNPLVVIPTPRLSNSEVYE
ncbi:hypothetical protein ACOSP7_025594 [Xanthoceras sorbifolium]|uniref:Cytochrome P450 n=1 Tax=Xanthoceras sorbifolium TaxID=99658 RepID=A0ABQ8H6M1_9ROSI|nr:hypothetical protein JRO89_XS13G0049900 [Xanthoceras sorbifolium]